MIVYKTKKLDAEAHRRGIRPRSWMPQRTAATEERGSIRRLPAYRAEHPTEQHSSRNRRYGQRNSRNEYKGNLKKTKKGLRAAKKKQIVKHFVQSTDGYYDVTNQFQNDRPRTKVESETAEPSEQKWTKYNATTSDMKEPKKEESSAIQRMCESYEDQMRYKTKELDAAAHRSQRRARFNKTTACIDCRASHRATLITEQEKLKNNKCNKRKTKSKALMEAPKRGSTSMEAPKRGSTSLKLTSENVLGKFRNQPGSVASDKSVLDVRVSYVLVG